MPTLLVTHCIVTVTLSAFLLFLIQPLTAKAILPFFGGVPSVWNICMFFFQSTLLVSYGYVYFINRFFKIVWQQRLHFALALISLGLLPSLLRESRPSLEIDPAWSVLKLLLIKLTAPLFIICATSPLIQSWFSKTNHRDAQNPYFLYSASNSGSLLALISFPFVLEPLLGLQRLTLYWTYLYGFFVLVLFFTARKCKTKASQSNMSSDIKVSIQWRDRLHWILLSFAPASLSMAVTQYLTSDIIAVPLLWVLPLSIYLLTFIIAFSSRPIITPQWMIKNQVLFLIFPLICLGKETWTLPAWLLILFHLSGFFALSMVCLGELAAKKPDHSHLTEFYLWIAIGGFLGSLFNSFIAPQIFNGIYEFKIIFCLCILLRPSQSKCLKSHTFNVLLPILLTALLTLDYFLIVKHLSLYPSYDRFSLVHWIDLFIIISSVIIILDYDNNSFILTLNIAILFCYSQLCSGLAREDLLWQSRNFFGVTKVYKNDKLNLHILLSGTTLHGSQISNVEYRSAPATTYYQPIHVLSKYFSNLKQPLNVAIAGLGTGGLSCSFRPQDNVYFYEIDPDIITIAQTKNLFSYLQHCPPLGGVIIGDARINIAKQVAHFFDVIIIDAFSSDAVPAHLFTREAMQIYFKKLKQDGLLIFHVSSRYLDLTTILATMMQDLARTAYSYHSIGNDHLFQAPSEWILFTQNESMAKVLLQELHWKKLRHTRPALLWTDDYSNILQALK